MYQKLAACIEELQETRTDAEIAGGLAEYFQIVKGVAEDYDDSITVAELREEHPELDFFEDDELEEILEQAKILRSKRKSADEDRHLSRRKLKEKKARILREIHSTIDARAEVEKGAVLAIARGNYAGASALLSYLDDGALRGFIKQLSAVNRELEGRQGQE